MGLPENPKIGQIYTDESFGRKLRFRWQARLHPQTKEFMEYHWKILCEIPGCDNDRAWQRGERGVCDQHRYGNGTKRHVLYRHWSYSELLYIGITNDPFARLRGHRAQGEFWDELMDGGYTTYECFATREDLIEAEKNAIENESPKYNKQFNVLETTKG